MPRLSLDNADEDCSRKMCEGDPVTSCKTDDDEEVPLGGRVCPQTCEDIVGRHGGSEIFSLIIYSILFKKHKHHLCKKHTQSFLSQKL